MSQQRPAIARRALGRLRAAGVSLMSFALCCGVLGLDAARAEGRDIGPAEYQRFRDSLLEAEGPLAVQGVLGELEKSSRGTHAEVYGQIVGPILRNPALTAQLPPERRRMVLAVIIAHLINDQPEGEQILLVSDVLARLAGDEALLQHVKDKVLQRHPTTGRKAGWERLVRRARERLLAEEPRVRAAAIRVAAHCEPEDAAVVLSELYEGLRAGEEAMPPAVRQAYLDAAQVLLKFRFPDVGALQSFLAPLAKQHFGTPESREQWTRGDKEHIRAQLYAAVIERMRSEGGQQATRERQAALGYGRAVIAKAEGPGDLLVFFPKDGEGIPELQQEALRRADGLEPKPTEAWAQLLVATLERSDHMGVLEAAVSLLTKTFTAPSEPGQAVASAVAERLVEGVESDRIDLREKLATVLGRIGKAKDVLRALSVRSRVPGDTQKGVWSQLIRGIGIVPDGQVLSLRLHYEPVATRPEWERRAVAETLGQQGFRPGAEQATRAKLLLLHILHGWAGAAVTVEEARPDGQEPKTVVKHLLFVNDGETDGLATEAALAALSAGKDVFRFDRIASPDPSPVVREEAAKSLLFLAGPHAARALAKAAAEESDVGDAALRTLGLQLRRDTPEALRALAGLVGDLESEARLLATLEVITRTPAPKDAADRAILGRPVVALLSGDASPAVRQAAAAAAAHLQQLDALKPVYLTWYGLAPDDAEGRKTWAGLLRQVVAGIVQAGGQKDAGDLDARFEKVVRELVDQGAGHEENAGLFARILADLGADAARFPLKRLRAELAMQYVGVSKGRTIDQRRAELDEVIALYRQLAGEAAPALRSEMQRMLYMVLHERWSPTWLKTGEGAEDPAPWQLEALQAAVESGASGTAGRALESEVQALQKRDDLGKEQADRLAKLLPRLQAVKDGNGAAKGGKKKDG